MITPTHSRRKIMKTYRFFVRPFCMAQNLIRRLTRSGRHKSHRILFFWNFCFFRRFRPKFITSLRPRIAGEKSWNSTDFWFRPFSPILYGTMGGGSNIILYIFFLKSSYFFSFYENTKKNHAWKKNMREKKHAHLFFHGKKYSADVYYRNFDLCSNTKKTLKKMECMFFFTHTFFLKKSTKRRKNVHS